MAFLNQGDEVLIPNPGYPTYESVTKLVGDAAAEEVVVPPPPPQTPSSSPLP